MKNQKLLSPETIERVRRDNCFDFLRYLFAFSLILVHFCTLTETEQFWVISGQTRVKAFFTITGFLVVYSYLRHDNLKTYATKRLRRIMPAYVTVIIFCTVAGLAVTPASTTEYITSAQTWRYLAANLTMLNFIEPSLPGLFPGHYEEAVNGSLWSMKFEMLFYALIPIIIWLMRRYGKLAVLIAVFAVYLAYRVTFDYLEDHHPEVALYGAINHASFNTMVYFFSGMVLILYFDIFCRHVRIIFPATVALLLLLHVANLYVLNYIEPLLFSALLIGVAYYCRPLNFLQHHDNISYGLYLYHYPVIQVLIMAGVHRYNIWLTFALALAITIALAALSWHYIEKPILKETKIFKNLT